MKKCTLPLTAVREVDMIVTELGVFDVIQGKGIVLREVAPGVTVDEVVKATDAELIISEELLLSTMDRI